MATCPRGLLGLAIVAAAIACGDPGGDPEAGPGAGTDAPAAEVGDAGADASRIGRAAPEYSARTLDGEKVALADFQGDAVLLNVWATWCAPCRQEIPELQSLHEEFADRGLRIVGVTVDSRSALDAVRTFMEDYGMTYRIWHDPDQTALSTFGGVGVPITVLVGRDGRIAWEHLGAFQRDDPALRGAIEAAL